MDYFTVAKRFGITAKYEPKFESNDPLEVTYHDNYIKIRDFKDFLVKINKPFGLSGERNDELFIPRNIISLKKHLYSIKFVFDRSKTKLDNIEAKCHYCKKWFDMDRVKGLNEGKVRCTHCKKVNETTKLKFKEDPTGW